MHKQKKLLVVPVKDIRTLSMVWPIPDLQPYYTSNVRVKRVCDYGSWVDLVYWFVDYS